jgi:hypothetical protein
MKGDDEYFGVTLSCAKEIEGCFKFKEKLSSTQVEEVSEHLD